MSVMFLVVRVEPELPARAALVDHQPLPSYGNLGQEEYTILVRGGLYFGVRSQIHPGARDRPALQFTEPSPDAGGGGAQAIPAPGPKETTHGQQCRFWPRCQSG